MTGRLTWLGHATTLIELGGARLLTDPLLRRRVAHLRRHAAPATAPARLDAILVSHAHHDHLDMASLGMLDADVPVVAPGAATRVLRRTGRTVMELTPDAEIELGGVRIAAVPAVHDGRRWPLGARAAAVGFVVSARHRVYFAGDTDLFEGMAGLGPLDAALLPIWGWGPKLGAGHMNPDDAARALVLLRPGLAVPIHWGTYLPVGAARRHARTLVDPARAFAERAAELAPHTRVALLHPGDAIGITRDG
jgi:L-ascorbate metabolism protein UlaG (beta-lactamase superfamily)